MHIMQVSGGFLRDLQPGNLTSLILLILFVNSRGLGTDACAGREEAKKKIDLAAAEKML